MTFSRSFKQSSQGVDLKQSTGFGGTGLFFRFARCCSRVRVLGGSSLLAMVGSSRPAFSPGVQRRAAPDLVRHVKGASLDLRSRQMGLMPLAKQGELSQMAMTGAEVCITALASHVEAKSGHHN